MANKVCAIVGYGSGLGAAYARAFAGAGYELALLSRSGTAPGADLPAGQARSYAVDAGDADALTSALTAVERDIGEIDVLVYNASTARFGPLEDIQPDQFEAAWRVAVLGLFATARHLAPKMTARGAGTIVVSGATASLRGAVWTTAFAPAKAAQRILAQSLAKQLGPKGVHVACLIIDGVIDTDDTRKNFAPDEPDEFFMSPDAIAGSALMLVDQDRSAWTFELDLRPFGETW